MTTTDHRLTMTEAQLQDAVVDLAHTLGYSVAHFRPARTSKGHRTPVQYDAAGWPDLVLVGRGRVLYRELKREREAPSSAQVAWIRRLQDAGQDVEIWRPSHYVSGAIEQDLLRREA